MEIKKMTEKEFLEKALQNGYDKEELLCFIKETKDESKRFEAEGVNLPVEVSLALSFEGVFKDPPCLVEHYPSMPPVEDISA